MHVACAWTSCALSWTRDYLHQELRAECSHCALAGCKRRSIVSPKAQYLMSCLVHRLIEHLYKCAVVAAVIAVCAILCCESRLIAVSPFNLDFSEQSSVFCASPVASKQVLLKVSALMV